MAETAVCDSFATFALGLQTSSRLRAIFLDECYVPVTASTYRPKLAGLDWLRIIPCQYVLLTGTLPPSIQDPLADLLLLGISDDRLRYIRARTDKANVAYSVETWEDRLAEKRVC